MRIFYLGILLLSFSCFSFAKQPNILFILVDDASPESFSAYGINDIGNANTPNIDSIGNQGVIFETVLAPAICQPSRVQIMTGRYANRTGNYYNSVWHNSDSSTLYQQHIPFSKTLKDAGYATAIAGKWDAGPSTKLTSDVGFDHFMIKAYHEQIKKLPSFSSWGGTAYYEQSPNNPSRYWYPAYTTNVEYDSKQQTFTGQTQAIGLLPSVLNDYGPNLEAKFISSFIEKAVNDEQPFLAYWPTVAPHGTGKGRLPSTPTRGVIGDLGDGPDGNSKPAVGGTEYLARFQALNEYLDSQIGEVLDKISELGIQDNTIIVFASDNGSAIAGKTRGVERGSHVALMFSGPGIMQRKSLSKALTDTADLAPTLLELAGVYDESSQKHKFDGQSLVPYLSGSTDLHRDWIYANTAGSQILRTEQYLLEAVNQLYLNHPNATQGRFYFTANNRFGEGYQLLSEDSEREHVQQRARFQKILELSPLSPLSRENLSQDELTRLTAGTDTNPEKHLFNDKYHKFYPEDFHIWPNLKQITEELLDSDIDGIDDQWESSFGMDILNSQDAKEDLDSDNLSNLEEYQLGTNPVSDDTDGDTLPDDWEVNNKLNPTDASDKNSDNDMDGLSNVLEYQYHTSPFTSDSDDDGLPDGWEVNNKLNANDFSDAALDSDNDNLTNLQEFQQATNPNSADSDGDSLPDGWEVKHQLNANDANDAALDNDNDGLSNLVEFQQQSDPNIASSPENNDDVDNNTATDSANGSEKNTDSSSGGSIGTLLLLALLPKTFRTNVL